MKSELYHVEIKPMSQYGNVPVDDVAAVTNATHSAVRIASTLSPAVPEDWRTLTYSIVLDGILSDWVANGNTEIEKADEDDLANLVKLAADTALKVEPAVREVTFQVLVKQVINDWVVNWNDESD